MTVAPWGGCKGKKLFYNSKIFFNIFLNYFLTPFVYNHFSVEAVAKVRKFFKVPKF